MACKLARQLSGMPYRYSYMSRKGTSFVSSNHEYGDVFQLSYKPGDVLTGKSALDIWLTERYSLSQESKKGMQYFDVHHAEWPMQKVTVEHLTANYPRFSQLIKDQPDLCHYSEGVQVLAWNAVSLSSIP